MASRKSRGTGKTEVKRELVATKASEWEPKPIEWLWPGRIAMGKLTLLVGDWGLGKSTLTIDMAARVTTGKAWPDQPNCGQKPGSVILLSPEDDIADTVIPRLMTAGADTERVAIVQGTKATDADGDVTFLPFTLSGDLSRMEEMIAKTGDTRLVVIDPITEFLGKANQNRNDHVRRAIRPLKELAERCRIPIVAVTHINKNNQMDAKHRILGAGAFGAVPRAAWSVVEDPKNNERKLFLPMKNNLGKKGQGLAFTIVNGELLSGFEEALPVIQWEEEPINKTFEEITSLDDQAKCAPKRMSAKEFLLNLLADGPVWVKEVFQRGKELGFSQKKLREAGAELGIISRQNEKQGKWYWRLPPKSADVSESAAA